MAPRECEATATLSVGEADAERVRWYLEDDAEFPADPAPQVARSVESVLASVGHELFPDGVRRAGRGPVVDAAHRRPARARRAAGGGRCRPGGRARPAVGAAARAADRPAGGPGRRGVRPDAPAGRAPGGLATPDGPAAAGAAGDLAPGRPRRRAVPVGGIPAGALGRGPDGRAGAGRAASADVHPAQRRAVGCGGRGPAVPRGALRRPRRVPRRHAARRRPSR